MIELKVKKIVCFSGGKDSTAMLIHLIETDSQIDDILYVGVGDWMWSNAEDHLKEVEQKLGVKITRLDAESEIKKGFERYGFPSLFNRYCTGIKRDTMRDYLRDKYLTTAEGESNVQLVQYIGYCSDEERRTDKKIYSAYDVEYPLVEAGITTEEALQKCYEYGFNFGGIYEHHHHYNCWMCPFQKIDELYYIFKEEPLLWSKLREMQFQTDGYYNHGESIFEYDKKFWLRNHKELRDQRLQAREKYRQK